jgi:hypothetical protein
LPLLHEFLVKERDLPGGAAEGEKSDPQEDCEKLFHFFVWRAT